MHRGCSNRLQVECLERRRLFAVAAGFLEEEFASGLSSPTAFAFAPDGRLFVAQQTGELRVIKDGALLPQSVLSLDVDNQGERGLIGIAIDPAFAQNGLVYVHYTTETPTIHNRVSRFTVVGDAIDANTEQVLLDLPTLSGATNHNGGAIHFGIDGKLYVAVGDNADQSTSQPLTTVLGKILRINADGSIPDDNPFLDETTGQSQAIWANGLRNPYTFAVRSDGRIHINDVGQSSFEEINLGVEGGNYGWPITEGKRTARQNVPANYVDPLFAYDRSGGPVSGPAIAGGAFYETPAGASTSFPAALEGDYLFSDWGSGFVKSLDIATRKVLPIASGLSGPLDIAVGSDGGVYVLEYNAGRVTRITASPPDLAVTMTEGPKLTTATQFDRDRVKVRIENVGTTAFNERTNIHMELVATGLIAGDTTAVSLQTRRINLKPGAGINLTLRFNYIGAGSQRVGVRLSLPDSQDFDANSANNRAVSDEAVTIALATNDLTPAFRQESLSLSVDGARQNVIVDVRNLGTVAFNGDVEIALSLTPHGGGSVTPVSTVSATKRIASQSDKLVRARFRISEGLAAGSYDLSATVTASGELADADPSNDSAFIPAIVG